MNPHRLLVLMSTATLLGGCVDAPPRPPPRDGLQAAYDEMKAAMAVGADEYDHADLETARDRYNLGIAQLQQDYERAQQLAEEAQTLARLAKVKSEAAKAAEDRKTAQAQVDELENMVKPQQ